MKEITLSYVLERAKRCLTYSNFQRKYFQLYTWSKENGHLNEIETILPPVSYLERARRAALSKAYTKTELAEHAKSFSSRAEWRANGEEERRNGHYSHYGAALHYGRDFMQQCCAHMQSGAVGNQNGLKHTDEQLFESAKLHQHKSDWKKADSGAYQMALRRGIFVRATAHMTPKAHPYSGSYVIYAYEFTDKHVYIGLTFLPKTRHAQHMCRGRVFEHIKVCPEYAYKIIEQSISDPASAGARERHWMAHYEETGWTILNKADGGGLGTIQVTKWTKEAIIEEAKKYKTKQEWIDKSQMSYRLAKREAWFEEASAHMPRRVMGVGTGRNVSAISRAKMRAAKLGTKQSAAHRRARSVGVKEWWVRQNATPLGPP